MSLLVTTGRRPRFRPRSRPRSRPVRRPGLYGFIGSGNLGNDASFEVVLDWLRGCGGEAVFPRVITLAPEAVRERYGVETVALRIADPLPDRTGWTAALLRVGTRLLDLPRTLWLVRGVDAVIVPGMGVLEEKLGVRPWGLPLWLATVGLACRLLRRPLVLVCVGAEPIRDPVTRRLFVAAVALADHVSYRDALSAEAMARCGAREPDAVAADLVLARSPGPVHRPEPGRVVVGVMRYFGDSDLPDAGDAANRAYLRALTTVVEALLDGGDQVVLVGGDRVDRDAAERLRATVVERRPGLRDEALQVRPVDSYDDLCAEMARAEVVVATRFHNLICALSVGVPVVSVGYADKNAALMSDLGLSGFSQCVGDFDPHRLLVQLDRARHSSWPRQAVAARLHQRAAAVEQVLDDLAHRLDLGGPR